MAEGEIPPQATNGSRSHSSLPSLKAGLFISLSVIFMIKPSFISLTSQILTLLVEVMKTNHGLRLVLLLVFVTVFVFLTSNINRNENASSNDNNDEHEWISSNFSSYPDDDDDDLLYHYYQQREDQVHEERRESNFQPKTPTSLLPVRPPVSAGTKENKEHTQKSIHTILNPQKPSSTAAQKPPSPDEEVMRSNRVDQHGSSGTTSPSPQAGARWKPLSPLKRTSWSSSEDEKASSSSNSPSFSPFLQPPPPPPFEIRPQKHTLYARIQSDNSSSCDSPDPMSSSPDINVKSEHFISKVKADLKEQGRWRSNLAGPRSSKTRRKKEEHV